MQNSFSNCSKTVGLFLEQPTWNIFPDVLATEFKRIHHVLRNTWLIKRYFSLELVAGQRSIASYIQKRTLRAAHNLNVTSIEDEWDLYLQLFTKIHNFCFNRSLCRTVNFWYIWLFLEENKTWPNFLVFSSLIFHIKMPSVPEDDSSRSALLNSLVKEKQFCLIYRKIKTSQIFCFFSAPY